MNRRTKNDGLTLIELLVVIAIIGILASVLIVGIVQARRAAHDAALQAYVHNCVSHIEQNLADPYLNLADLAGSCANLDGMRSLPQSVTSAEIIDNGDGSYTVDSEGTTGSTVVISGGNFIYTRAW